MIEAGATAAIRGIVLCPCANHIVNLVFRNTLESDAEFIYYFQEIKSFQRVMRRRDTVRQGNRSASRFCLPMPRGQDLEDTEFREGIPPLYECLHLLEELRLALECRKTSLWMVPLLVEDAKRMLLDGRFDDPFPWIGKLATGFAQRLMARFRTIFNARAATAPLLSAEGRWASLQTPQFPGIPPDACPLDRSKKGDFPPLTTRAVLGTPFNQHPSLWGRRNPGLAICFRIQLASQRRPPMRPMMNPISLKWTLRSQAEFGWVCGIPQCNPLRE
jgi:hypothetical protein